jgi:SAM-dependent methyltransferase
MTEAASAERSQSQSYDQNEAEEVVKELYRGILNREPEEQYLKIHAETLHNEGLRGGLSKMVKHFLSTQEFRKRAIDPNGLSSSFLINSSRIYLDRVNQAFAKSIPVGSKMLDIGAGIAPYRKYFAHTDYESADFEKVSKDYGETTYVCDITVGIPVEDGRFEFLLFNQTLEHINEPMLALKELNRVLAPGGTLLCTVPLFYEEHEQPYDFFRYTQFAHRHMFKQAGFEIEKIDWLEGFFGTCGYMLECIYKYVPESVPGSSSESLWAKAFLSAFRPIAFAAAGAFYKMDLTWKITHVGFPKNYVIFARKPAIAPPLI